MLDHFIHLKGFQLLIIVKWLSITRCLNDFKTWLRKTSSYINWLDRVAKSHKEDWKKWSINDIIMLSWHDIPIKTTLMFGFLGFWATFIYGFNFPFISMSLTLLDIMTITSLLVESKEILTLFSLLIKDLGI